jgi:hypothetical protein
VKTGIMGWRRNVISQKHRRQDYGDNTCVHQTIYFITIVQNQTLIIIGQACSMQVFNGLVRSERLSTLAAGGKSTLARKRSEVQGLVLRRCLRSARLLSSVWRWLQ